MKHKWAVAAGVWLSAAAPGGFCFAAAAAPLQVTKKSNPPLAQPNQQVLTDAVAHGDSAARLHVASVLAEDSSAHGVMLLYLLARDADEAVQTAALAATLHRCAHESPFVCASMMQFFVEEANDSETHWQARDWLLFDEPYAATRHATDLYKLDVVARMSERVDQPEVNKAALRVLRLLAEDPEPEVQEAAAAALLRARL